MKTITTVLDRDKMLTELVCALLVAKEGRYLTDNGLVTVRKQNPMCESVEWEDPEESIVVVDASILLESIEKVANAEAKRLLKKEAKEGKNIAMINDANTTETNISGDVDQISEMER